MTLVYTDAVGVAYPLDEWADLYDDPRARFLDDDVIPGVAIIRLVYTGMSVHQDTAILGAPFCIAMYTLDPISVVERVLVQCADLDTARTALTAWPCLLAGCEHPETADE